MSIWCSYPMIGDKDGDEPTGRVLRYEASHIYPSGQREAEVSIASIPSYCVPGHHQERDGAAGPWLRLDLYSDFDGYLAVVLDEDATRALSSQLAEWLVRPKVHPEVRDA